MHAPSEPIALITGASRGLGACLLGHFWAAGFGVVAVASDEQALQRVVSELPPRPGQFARAASCDLADLAAVESIFESLAGELPRLDVLINNAAIQGPIGPVWAVAMPAWQRAVSVDLVAPVAVCSKLIPLLVRSGGGSIINLSGGGASAPRANFSAYAAAKAGLVRFTETLAEELRHVNINANCIAPGAMNTALLREVLDAGADTAGMREVAAVQKVVDGGGAAMQAVADLALALARPDARRITGRLISAVWDDWPAWLRNLDLLEKTDAYTLRRITGRDRGLNWGDK